MIDDDETESGKSDDDVLNEAREAFEAARVAERDNR